ncbi:hypothetical protein [Paractinoplanes hotanensis]|uniref:Uncharacterized protein n=1 Tax=Paractinoplanes hotanensis TaxID=2906497 RepID=A0ABT0Y871_9ACTN|nr:hypothetical protein [Actinoplanes hotanensis]MCM4081708.1 hypothetical protein [Actinoplanes hotanensis]
MAVYLLYAVAAIQVINALTTFSIAGQLTDAIRDVYAGTEAEGAESFIGAIFVGGAIVNLLIGIGFAVLALFDGRGKNPARIVTWVIGGISLCCFGVSLGSTALAGSMGTGTTTGGPSEAEVQQRLEEALPSWYSASNTTLSVIALLAILATVILLALPAANEFFRKPAAAWDPSVPYPQYPGGAGYGQPGYPAQPPYPGQPFPGQPTSGPSYPGQPTSGPSYPGQPSSGPSYPGQQGQPGQPAPGLSPYPGQAPPPASAFPPPSDPFAPPPVDPNPPPSTSGDQPPKPPTDPA